MHEVARGRMSPMQLPTPEELDEYEAEAVAPAAIEARERCRALIDQATAAGALDFEQRARAERLLRRDTFTEDDAAALEAWLQAAVNLSHAGQEGEDASGQSS
jgi:hypothetical protein